MLLSIIIPVFNAEVFLEKCIKSIRIQKNSNIEIIIVDDCSTDSSLDIIKEEMKKDNRIKLIKNDKNQLAGKTRNIGVSFATGDFIWFIDADDWLNESSIEKIINHIEEKQNIDLFLLGFTEHMSTKNKYTYIPDEKTKKEEGLSFFLQIRKGFYSMPFVYIFNSKLLKEHNITFMENVYYEDINFIAKAIYFSHSISILPKNLYNYNKKNNYSITKSPTSKKIEDLILSYEQLKDFLEDNNILKKYNLFFLNRFIVFGLTRCFKTYYMLPNTEKKMSLNKNFQSLEIHLF